MSYVTRNPADRWMPTVWKDSKDCVDEWARVKEVRKTMDFNKYTGPLNPVIPQGL